jgi:glutamyl-tRNA synthetase
MTAKVRTRFAPSPTGYMHIGNLRTALYAYLIAKAKNGVFILRVEDTDQERYVEGSVDIIYKTLKLAGLSYDEGPDQGGNFGPYIQSDRKHIYLAYAEKLIELGHAYYCFCSKERLDMLRKQSGKPDGSYLYDRHCLGLDKDEVQKKLDNGEPHVIRQKMPQTGTTTFKDTVFGAITVDNSTLEDQILIKSDGLPTYNFANVIDDHLMKVTHVVRGSEYLSSAPKHILLYGAYGWDVPVYIHVPHILKPSGKKLSKREGHPSFEDLLSMGFLAEAVVNYVALLGWSPSENREFFTLGELVRNFNISGISKSPAVFDIEKLKWMNKEYLRNLPFEEFHRFALPYYEKQFKNDRFDIENISGLLQGRINVLTEIPEKIDFFAGLPEYEVEIYIHKKSKTTLENSLQSLEASLPVLKDITSWHNEYIYGKLIEVVKELGIKNSQMFWPLRIALSGKTVTPGGATEIAEILGKEESIKRIEIGIGKLKSSL